MANLLILPRYSKMGASSRYRLYNYTDYLESNGFTCTVKPLFSNKYLTYSYSYSYSYLARIVEAVRCYVKRVKDLYNIKEYDLVLIEKEVFPFIPAWLENYFFLSRMNYILDYDDAIFHRYDCHKNKIIQLLLSQKIPDIARNAACVISGNQYISDYFYKHAQKDRVIIPTAINVESYDQISVEKNRQFTIVWIGTPSTSKYVENISDSLRKVFEKIDGKLVMIGAKATLPGVPVEFIKWSKDSEIKYLKSAHVGIMPLSDQYWERGKCGFKLIQYMASRIPMVASPVGVNSSMVEHGINGYLANTPDDWVNFLCKVYSAITDDMGAKGYERAVSCYSYTHTSPILLQVLKLHGRERNIDRRVVSDFGKEWTLYNNDKVLILSMKEIWKDYFSIFPWNILPKDGGVGMDIGCGSGRWAEFIAPKVKKLYLVDPSIDAINVAKNKLSKFNNLEFMVASADTLLVDNETLDFAYSLGVLHHIPDINQSFHSIASKLKKGAPFLVYLYYSFDNKPKWYYFIWKASDYFRKIISHLPFRLKVYISKLIAITVYWPLSRLSYLIGSLGLQGIKEKIPLNYYSNKSVYIMKNDALDRFGTKLEHRLSKDEIKTLFVSNGFIDVKFSDREPYWCACGIKK